MLLIICPQPVRFPTREAKARLPQLVEMPTDLVKGCASVVRTDANFIKSVDKERLVVPFGMALRIEGQKVAGSNQAGFLSKFFALGLKRSRLPCPRIAEQHIGWHIPERFEKLGFLLPMLIRVLC
ncbi:MAG: hypothetical protein F4Z85_22430 [Gemmatimonadetes bacterium]|nr:hypothetical protein [Gemmatimonadota bacterium]